jgi:hypothetical protein
VIEVVERALEPQPAARWGSASELEEALRGAIEDEQGEAEPLAPGDRRRWPAWTAAGLVLVVAAVVATSILSWRGDSSRSEMAVPAPATAATDTAAAKHGPAQPLPLDIEVRLLRGSDPSGPLMAGSAVAAGDLLQMEVETVEPIHLYVLNEDRQGGLFVLFPIAGLELANPLPTGHHRLPGPLRGVPQNWQVTSAGGTEVILVIASRAPLLDLERELVGFQMAAEDRAQSAPAEPLRGIGGLTRASRDAAGDSPLEAIHSAMRSRHEEDGTVWVERFELVNPRG